VSLAPLALAIALSGWVVARRMDALAWREGAGVFHALAVGAAVALIGQVYHLDADPYGFVITWLALGLPVIYVLGSAVPACLYVVGITAALGWADHDQKLGVAILAAGLAPWVVTMVRTAPGSPRLLLFRWVAAACVPFAAGLAVEHALDGAWVAAYTGAFAVCVLAGKTEGAPIGQRPFYVVGMVGGTVVALILTFADAWDHMAFATASSTAKTVDALLAGAVWLAGATLLARRPVSLRAEPVVTWPLVATVPGLALAAWTGHGALAAALMNLVVLGAGAIDLAAAVRWNRLARLNRGLALVSAVIILRFFDTDLSFLWRGVAFIALGLVFLGVNVWMNRRMKRQEAA
jgi:uncharacterized membrane protein